MSEFQSVYLPCYVIVNFLMSSLQNSYVDAGDDCVSFKPGMDGCTILNAFYLTEIGSTNIHVKNLTCVQTAGIAVGSLGQYQGQFDLVENITAEDITASPKLEAKFSSTNLAYSSNIAAMVPISRPTMARVSTIPLKVVVTEQVSCGTFVSRPDNHPVLGNGLRILTHF